MRTSAQLHDSGEESWYPKLHLGCGGVFLRNYINVDIAGELSMQHRGLVRQNATDVSNYYARLNGNMGSIPAPRQTVADLICDVTKLPYCNGSVKKILAIQVFEHLSPKRGVAALEHWHHLLGHGHPLVMSVPDTLGTLDLIDHSGDVSFALRHLRGSIRNPHVAWYTKESLTELLEFHGFSVEHLPNPHFYPAVCVRAIKR